MVVAAVELEESAKKLRAKAKTTMASRQTRAVAFGMRKRKTAAGQWRITRQRILRG